MNTSCKINGCTRPRWARGWCCTHYQRWRTTGKLTISRNENGHGTLNKGYRWLTVGGKRVYEHRMIMENILKRKLNLKREVVHHKDGNKLNNDPTNLEVMTRAEHVAHHRTTTICTSSHKGCSLCKRFLVHSKFSTFERRGQRILRSRCKACCNKLLAEWRTNRSRH